MIFANAKKFLEHATRTIYNKGEYQKWVIGASYGLSQTSSQIHEFLHILNKVDKPILLINCNNEESYTCLQSARNEYRNIKFIEVAESHAKYLLTSSGDLWIGSVNLTNGGNWFDTTLYLKMARQSRDFESLQQYHHNMMRSYYNYDSNQIAQNIDKLLGKDNIK